MCRYLSNAYLFHFHVSQFGSGGSTYTALEYMDVVYSVESDKQWCEMMINDTYIACHVRRKSLTYLCMHGGLITTAFGHVDIPGGSYALFHPYVNSIDNTGETAIDVVFVDGRFRVAAALKAVKYLTTPCDEESTVLKLAEF